jgi:hypothetical protein
VSSSRAKDVVFRLARRRPLDQSGIELRELDVAALRFREGGLGLAVRSRERFVIPNDALQTC